MIISIVKSIVIVALTHVSGAFDTYIASLSRGKPRNAYILSPRQSFYASPKFHPLQLSRMISEDLGLDNIVSYLEERYGRLNSHSRSDRLRNFLYQAKGAKTVLEYRNVREIVGFLDKEFQNDSLVLNILFTSPRILRKSVNNQLKPAVQFLVGLYGKDVFLEAISRNPDLLLTSGIGYNNGDVGITVENYLKVDVGLDQASINKMKFTNPQIFQLSVEKSLQPVVNLLTNCLTFDGIKVDHSRRVIKKIVLTHPSLFSLSITDNLAPTLKYLKESCRVELSTIIKSCPGILCLSLDLNIRQTVDYLCRQMTLNEDELRQCLCRHPQILALSLDNLRNKEVYFDAIDCLAGLNKNSTDSLARRILIKSPSVYSLSLKKNIMPTVNLLGKMWAIDASVLDRLPRIPEFNYTIGRNSLLARNIYEFPQILTLSLEGNIQPTIRFFNSTGYLNLDSEGQNQEVNTTLVRPRYLAASLFGRLLPRWHYLLEKYGLDISVKLPPLHLLTGGTDKSFCKFYAINAVDYAEYKIRETPRLKFSSQFVTWLKTGRSIDGI